MCNPKTVSADVARCRMLPFTLGLCYFALKHLNEMLARAQRQPTSSLNNVPSPALAVVHQQASAHLSILICVDKAKPCGKQHPGGQTNHCGTLGGPHTENSGLVYHVDTHWGRANSPAVETCSMNWREASKAGSCVGHGLTDICLAMRRSACRLRTQGRKTMRKVVSTSSNAEVGIAVCIGPPSLIQESLGQWSGPAPEWSALDKSWACGGVGMWRVTSKRPKQDRLRTLSTPLGCPPWMLFALSCRMDRILRSCYNRLLSVLEDAKAGVLSRVADTAKGAVSVG